jgi:tetratricopeptide (TPR) repeat protein
MTDASIRRSIPVLQQALRECPKFALGWAALANAHCAFARLGIVPPRKTFPKAKAAADRAIQLQDVAQARTARAFYHFLYEHDWNAAEADLVRALAIDPGYSMAMGAYAQLLFALGRNEDAVAMMRRACELDPVSINARTMLGWVLYYTNRYHEALAQLERAIELDPSAWIAEATKGLALLQLGRLEQAIPGLRSATERSAGSALAKAYLACGLAKAGDRPGAEEILQVLLKLRKRRYFSSYWIAAIHACMDNHSVALEWLKTAVEERCSWMVFAGADPHFAILRNDPWFRQTAGLLTLRRAS